MSTEPYFPAPDPEWETIDPETAGFNPELLQKAVDFAVTNETEWTRDLERPLSEKMAEAPPYNEIIGPVKHRGGPNGLILRGGRIVAEWGDTNRVDMTFSATKSYLSVCAGLAVDRGLIPDVHAPVSELVDDGGFEPPHNHKITWHHLLQQTSEWEGELWGKPDLIDRNRDVNVSGPQSQKGTFRKLQEPGAFYEYNDVRVNRLSLALLRVWRQPLPDVLKTFIMDPIGASNTWQWHGYRNSYITLDGEKMQSVSGGGHWGGGLFIHSRDHARFGYLMSRRGRWGGRQLLSDRWIDQATTSSTANPGYGYLFWLNSNQVILPSMPKSSFLAIGAGSNIVCMDPVHDIVAVVRWIIRDRIDGFFAQVLAALGE